MKRMRAFNLVVLMALLTGRCAGPGIVRASVDDGEPPPAANVQNNDFMVNEANFDQWVFQGSGNAAAGRARLISHLKLKLDELARVCSLEPVQRQKLMLAGQGDMKRFFDQVEVVRKKFLEVRNDQNRFNQIWQDISPLQQKLGIGLFGDASMFAKTVRKTLTEAQRDQYQAVQAERRRYRYHAMIEVSLVSLESTVALRDAQHEALAKLLIEETEPPLAFGQFDNYFVMYSLSKLPVKKVKPLLDSRQWQALQVQMNQGRGMEAALAQNGVIAAPRGVPAAGFFGAIFGPALDVPRAPVRRAQAVNLRGDEPADALMPQNRRSRINR